MSRPPAGEWPVLDLVLPLPLEVAADVYGVIGRALERRGYEVFVRESTGIGRVWIRFPPHGNEQTSQTAGAGGGGRAPGQRR